jgi:acyl carrier protein
MQESTIMAGTLIDELRVLLIEELLLEDIEPEDILADEPLFGEGLGLDSIDALEIAVLLDRQYGIKITAEDNRNQAIFASLNSLAEFIAANRTK